MTFMEIPFRNGWFNQEFRDAKLLGDSRVGKVFVAKRNDAMYAVKKTECPTRDGVNFASQEADVLRQLRHRHIVGFIDTWLEHCERPDTVLLFLQMELCETNTLRHHFNSMTFVNSRTAGLGIFKQIVSAVEFIHSKNWVHCNLEPWNILFEYGGHSVVKVGNFSFVSRRDQANAHSIDRPRGIFARLYMCPEQARANPTAPTFKWDIYNMGLIFLEIVNPISTDNKWNMWIEMMEEAEKLILPPRFDEVELRSEQRLIRDLLSHNPDERPTASIIIEEVDKIIVCLQGGQAEVLPAP